MEATRGSAQRGDSPSVTRSRVGEAIRSREAALITSDALDLLVMPSLARRRPAARASLGAVCGDAICGRRGAVIRTTALSATPALSCTHRAAEARSRAWGETAAAGAARVETLVAFVRAPMQKFAFPYFLCFATLTPNQAMQRTAGRAAIYLS